MTKTQKRPKISEVITLDVIACVKAYLVARAFAETMRAAVDAIHLEILTECPIYETRNGRDGKTPILKSGDLYRSDETHIHVELLNLDRVWIPRSEIKCVRYEKSIEAWVPQYLEISENLAQRMGVI